MAQNRDELKTEVKAHMITYLNLQDMTPADIKDDDILFKGELGLDSIDSLELIVMLEREYGIKIKSPTEGRKHLATVNAMVDLIEEHNS